MFRGEGFKMPGNLWDCEIKGVARRFAALFLNLPAMNPSMSGIIAAEIINEVNRKSALRYFLRNAEKIVNIPDRQNAAANASVRAIQAGREDSLTRRIAARNPPA